MKKQASIFSVFSTNFFVTLILCGASQNSFGRGNDGIGTACVTNEHVYTTCTYTEGTVSTFVMCGFNDTRKMGYDHEFQHLDVISSCSGAVESCSTSSNSTSKRTADEGCDKKFQELHAACMADKSVPGNLITKSGICDGIVKNVDKANVFPKYQIQTFQCNFNILTCGELPVPGERVACEETDGGTILVDNFGVLEANLHGKRCGVEKR